MTHGLISRHAHSRLPIGLLAAVLQLAGATSVFAIDAASDRQQNEPVPANTLHPTLRVLTLAEHASGDARRGTNLEFDMIADFAQSQGMEIKWVEVYRPRDLYDKLVRGDGDVIIGTLPPELLPNQDIVSSESLATERYQVVGRLDNTAGNPLDLAGQKVATRLSSPLWSYLERLTEGLPAMRLVALPTNLDRDEILRQVADGNYDVTVIPTGTGDDTLADHPRLKPLFNLTEEQPVSWYVRRDDTSLLTTLNAFISRFHTAYIEPFPVLRDFRAIQQRGVLRVITRLDPHNYFLDRGRPSGYEYELARQFAQAHGLRLEVLVGKNDREILAWLKTGVGDVVLTRMDSALVRGDPSFRMSRRYHYTAYVPITGSGRADVGAGGPRLRSFAVYEGSPEQRALLSLKADDPQLQVIAVDPRVTRTRLLARVSQGEVDATLVNGDSVAETLSGRSDLVAGPSLPHHYQYRWIVRGGDEKLLSAVNQFLYDSYQNGVNSLLANRYFGEQLQRYSDSTQGISPFDQIVQNYADQYGFDWRLISAQIYQESQFNPRAQSPRGARGLMQMLPSTARSLGFSNVENPDVAIHAGVKYLYELRGQFDEGLPASERTWFALAAYNIGVDRVERARRLAKILDLDPNKWFGNVEFAMLQMAQRRDSLLPRCDCGQAIIYVETIRSLYGAYRYLQISATPSIAVRREFPPA